MANVNGTVLRLASLMGLAWVMPGWAQPAFDREPAPRVIEDRLRLEMNVFSASFSGELRVDAAPDDPGTLFEPEGDMGLKDTALLPRVELTLLPGARHLLRFSSLRARRTGGKILTRDIAYDEDVYVTGERVRTSTDLDMIDITYGYQFLRGSRGDLAATVGVLLGDYRTNAEVIGRGLRDPSGEVVPLPVAGLEATLNVSPRWSLEARAQYSSVALDLIEGSLTMARFAAKWQLNPHIAFGLGYRMFDVKAESMKETSPGLVDMQFNGFELFMRASL